LTVFVFINRSKSMTAVQKKLSALAIAAAFAGSAFAQTNVTIYGVADAGFVNSSGDRANGAKNANFNGINSGIMSGSRLGFKGEEGLGNGLKAVFLLEYSLGIDVNGGVGSATGSSANSRQSYVGLSHNRFGTVALGRQYAPGYNAASRNNPFGGSTAQAPLNLLTAAAGNSLSANEASRINNAVTYASPVWNGFSANAIYGFAENGGTTADGISQGNGGVFGAGLNYANGPINLDLVFQQRSGVATNPVTTSPVTTVSTQDNINEWALLGSYDFKVVKVFGSYQSQDDNNGTSAREGSNKTWQVGANIPVFGNGSIQASYAKLSWDRTGAGDNTAWALGYRHALSKRTTLYTTYTLVDNDNNALAAAGYLSQTRAIGEKNATLTAGLNHTF